MGVILLLSDRSNAYTCKLLKLWPGFCDKIKEHYPSIEFVHYLDWKYDKENNLPKSFEIYYKWFPQIIYFPDSIWKRVMDGENIDLKQHSFVMNGVFDDHKGLQYVIKYNIMKLDDYITWLHSVISSP